MQVNTLLVLTESQLLANDSDADGDTLTISFVSSAANGGEVAWGNGSISYQPAPNFTGTDSFTYKIADGHGGEATGVVSIVVAPVSPPMFTLQNMSKAANGNLVLSFTAQPQTTWILQASTNLTTWQSLAPVTVGANGVATWEDTASAMAPYRFYRLAAAPGQ
jgi:hypothetical protein